MTDFSGSGNGSQSCLDVWFVGRWIRSYSRDDEEQPNLGGHENASPGR